MIKKCKVSKKDVKEFRHWNKIAMVLKKMLAYVASKQQVLEVKFLDSVKETGPCVVDGVLLELVTRMGHTSVSYKDVVEKALELLSEKKKKELVEYMESIRKPASSTEVLKVTDTELVFYAGQLKDRDVVADLNQIGE